MNKKENEVETRNNLFLQGIYPSQKAENRCKSFTSRQYGYRKAQVVCRHKYLGSDDPNYGYELFCSIESPEGKVCIPHSEINRIIKDLVRYKKHFEIPDDIQRSSRYPF